MPSRSTWTPSGRSPSRTISMRGPTSVMAPQSRVRIARSSVDTGPNRSSFRISGIITSSSSCRVRRCGKSGLECDAVIDTAPVPVAARDRTLSRSPNPSRCRTPPPTESGLLRLRVDQPSRARRIIGRERPNPCVTTARTLGSLRYSPNRSVHKSQRSMSDRARRLWCCARHWRNVVYPTDLLAGLPLSRIVQIVAKSLVYIPEYGSVRDYLCSCPKGQARVAARAICRP